MTQRHKLLAFRNQAGGVRCYAARLVRAQVTQV